ncbi:hypothetical protein AB1Y20_010581 [Prymnesium parvum]|uniref:Uncharacterized protein n=1 Tax=Prymnesium parvum TaxID=97485 RepID=A0AB34IQ41_PRYPA
MALPLRALVLLGALGGACSLVLPPHLPGRGTPCRISCGPASAGLSAAVLSLSPAAANAADGSSLPPDSLLIGVALTLLAATGLLQLSLGDVIADESELPSSTNLINKSRQKRSSFLKKKK